ncbi:hypothetical protein [Pseudonocardia acidicola]|uniref:Uncharacterized protein n=1 Tax=Pseudonocardia acidicola TaxID=2724939 RepID=A0ABX1SEJ2_9PSEU|nr:hypothetical protein [Pseudonocardia acidicola]NMH98898.1 hypothetical protein [Pseudonocardia acidicola]
MSRIRARMEVLRVLLESDTPYTSDDVTALAAVNRVLDQVAAAEGRYDVESVTTTLQVVFRELAVIEALIILEPAVGGARS